LAQNGKMVVKKSPENEYGIEVVTGRDASVMETAMVRYGDSGDMSDQQKMRDIAEEKSWCQDHAKLLKSLEARGIKTGFKYHLAPGEHPVKVVVSQSGASRKSTEAKMRYQS